MLCQYTVHLQNHCLYYILSKLCIFVFWKVTHDEKQLKKGYYAWSSYVSGNLPTYPSPKPTFCPKWEVSVNDGLGEG